MDITLRTRTEEHVASFWEKTQDEEIKRLFPFSSSTLEQALELYEESLLENARSFGKVIYYDGRYVGDIWCYGIDQTDEKMAMLSIVIFEKELWGKGVDTNATRLFTKEMFEEFKIEKIGAFTYAINYGSVGLLEKVGFVLVDTFVEEGIESKYYELRKLVG